MLYYSKTFNTYWKVISSCFIFANWRTNFRAGWSRCVIFYFFVVVSKKQSLNWMANSFQQQRSPVCIGDISEDFARYSHLCLYYTHLFFSQILLPISNIHFATTSHFHTKSSVWTCTPFTLLSTERLSVSSKPRGIDHFHQAMFV